MLKRYKWDRSILLHLAFHWTLVASLGVLAALSVDTWPWWAVLLLAPIAGHSLFVTAIAAHEIGHGSGGLRSKGWRALAVLFGWSWTFWATPIVQRKAHNILHHPHTNTPIDPDRRLTVDEFGKLGPLKYVAMVLAPSSWFWPARIWGLAFAVFSYHSNLFVNSMTRSGELYDVRLKPSERRRAFAQWLFNAGLYVGLWALSGFSGLMVAYVALAYFVGATIAASYIATNHLLHGLNDDGGDVLSNTVSLRMPRWVDRST